VQVTINLTSQLIYGLGWGLLGYCPGTSMGAVGEGRWDGLWGLLGMLAGAAIYAEAYPLMKRTVLTWGNLGKITLPGILVTNCIFLGPQFDTRLKNAIDCIYFISKRSVDVRFLKRGITAYYRFLQFFWSASYFWYYPHAWEYPKFNLRYLDAGSDGRCRKTSP
jgi:hypothetical protein